MPIGESPAVISHTRGSLCDGNCVRKSGEGWLSMEISTGAQKRYPSCDQGVLATALSELIGTRQVRMKLSDGQGKSRPDAKACVSFQVRAGTKANLDHLAAQVHFLSSSPVIAPCLNSGNVDRRPRLMYVSPIPGGDVTLLWGALTII